MSRDIMMQSSIWKFLL